VRNVLHPKLQDFQVILDEANIRLRGIGDKSDDAIREASFNTQDGTLRDVRSNGDAERAGLPQLALSETFLAVGLRVLGQIEIRSLDVSRLKKRIATAV